MISVGGAHPVTDMWSKLEEKLPRCYFWAEGSHLQCPMEHGCGDMLEALVIRLRLLILRFYG
jgi:hypothetical protein